MPNLASVCNCELFELQLDDVRGLANILRPYKLTQLILEGNPLTQKFEDHNKYVRYILFTSIKSFMMHTVILLLLCHQCLHFIEFYYNSNMFYSFFPVYSQRAISNFVLTVRLSHITLINLVPCAPSSSFRLRQDYR